MRSVFLVASVLILGACGAGGGDNPNLSPIGGSWSFTGKYCGDVQGQKACFQSLEPASCAPAQAFGGAYVEPLGLNINIAGQVKPMAMSGSNVTITGGPTFEVFYFTPTSRVFKFAAGCEMEYRYRGI